MRNAPHWFSCRFAYTETLRAIALGAGWNSPPARRFAAEWGRFRIVEIDQGLVETAAELADSEKLRTLDALHLASFEAIARPGTALATWDRRLHAVGLRRAVRVIPQSL